MNKLKRIDKSLEKLKDDLNRQIQAVGSDNKGFHDSLIDLSAKYPEHKDLLQFIVFVNDKLETNQNIYSEIIIDSLNELIDKKRELIFELDHTESPNKNSNEEKGWFKALLSRLDTLKDIKIISWAIAIIVLVIGSIFAPEVLLSVLKSIAGLIL